MKLKGENMLFIKGMKIRNFKSFKEATLAFKNGMVCFAGPNGSGKSNIADALRFALGEQSFKSLRVEKVPDLILHGAHSAEVTLVFDGDQKMEVKRAIHKDGKIHYKLDGKNATRTSIVNALRKMGIDPNMKNIIPQGEVEQIVEMTPKQRREIIDAASGVLDYEEKKKESMKELDKVEAKIQEATFIMNEREGMLLELEKEKEAALKYMEVNSQLRRYQASLIHINLKKIDNEHTKILEKYAELTDEEEEGKAELDKLDGQIKGLENEKQKIIDKINKEKAQEETFRDIERAKAELELSKNLLENTQNEIEKIEARRKQSEKLLKANEEENAAKKNEMKEREKKNEKVRKEREKLEGEYGIVSVEEERKRFRVIDEIKELVDKESRIRVEIETKKVELESTKTGLIGNQKNKDELETNGGKMLGKDLNYELGDLREKKNRHEVSLEQMFEKEKELNFVIPEIEKEILSLREKMAASPQRRRQVIQLIKEIRKDLDLKGVFGCVGELCSFDEKYSLAVESAAGGRMDYVVVDCVDTATRVINYLKKKKIGRITFLPLDVIRPRGAGDMKKGMGPLLNHIRYDGKYSKAMEFVFGDTLLVRDMEEAKRMKIGECRMVTLEGDLVEVSGVVSGGYFKPQFSIEIIEKKFDEMKKKREEIVSELQSIREEMAKLRNEKAETEIRIKSKELDLGRVKEKEDEEKKKKEKLIEIKKMMEFGQERISTLQEGIRNLEKQLLQLEKDRERLEKRVGEKQEATGEKKSELREAEEKLTFIKGEISSLEAEMEVKKREIGKLEQDKRTLEIEIEGIRKERREREEKVDEFLKKIDSLESRIEEKEREMKSAGKKLEHLWEEQKKYDGEIRGFAVRRGELSQKLDRIGRELYKSQVDREKFETRLADLKAEYSEYSRDNIEFIENAPLGQMEEKITEYKKEIESLGLVNLKAPEVFDERTKELQDTKVKVDKLIEEKRAVLKMITEIDGKKRNVFMEMFGGVRDNFAKLFKQIFKAEDAYLGLENEENPFEGGLHITVTMADGKKKLIDSLSGGEKSLVALLFVFAIQLVKPSPFYALDEADAALDKANSKKLAQLLKELSKSTQFVVITHNDTLMEHSDTLMGVAKEQGVSRIVGIELT